MCCLNNSFHCLNNTTLISTTFFHPRVFSQHLITLLKQHYQTRLKTQVFAWRCISSTGLFWGKINSSWFIIPTLSHICIQNQIIGDLNWIKEKRGKLGIWLTQKDWILKEMYDYEPLEIVECMILQNSIPISRIIEHCWSSSHLFHLASSWQVRRRKY